MDEMENKDFPKEKKYIFIVLENPKWIGFWASSKLECNATWGKSLPTDWNRNARWKKSTRNIVELFKLLVQNFNSTRILEIPKLIRARRALGSTIHPHFKYEQRGLCGKYFILCRLQKRNEHTSYHAGEVPSQHSEHWYELSLRPLVCATARFGGIPNTAVATYGNNCEQNGNDCNNAQAIYEAPLPLPLHCSNLCFG